MKKVLPKTLVTLLLALVMAVAPVTTASAAVGDLGIDVSYHQGAINWQAVAADPQNIKYAFIRVGSFKSGVDAFFHANMQGAQAAGIQTGAYIYSYSTSPEMAVQEALFTIACIQNYPVSYPVVYDVEDTFHKLMTTEQLQVMIAAFCNTVESAGYFPMVYSSRNWFVERIGNVPYEKWVAQYNTYCNYPNPAFWQFTSSGSVAGVQGRVDMNMQFKDFSAEIPANGFKQRGGGTFYYVNYIPQKGWVEDNGKRYYMDFLGRMQTGLVAVGTNFYYMGTDGAQQTGFQNIASNTYYFDPAAGGAMAVGWQVIDGKKYSFDAAGVMQKGFASDGVSTFYLQEDGSAATGLVNIGGSTYYFDANGVMQTGTVMIGTELHTFDASGVMIQ